ncbi:unnamed protein product [Adineta steineri]|uniref:NmrA-like domain-containing protein n=1 Tax=Adineta steineri TaxID=433720 RepID=A0A814SQI4_9BILA|nr:unnamed protein product [Adineta steineri]CAF1150459.1 unnamed protein product [Adineta steineri]CAF3664139.1 unnamed protein product [Adineta steineri]CAF3735742.1 unnamed protein product [Adineta steineri]
MSSIKERVFVVGANGNIGSGVVRDLVKKNIDTTAYVRDDVSYKVKQGLIGYAHTTAEEKLWALADSNPEQRSLVVLRPGSFMDNHFRLDMHHVKHSNKLVSCAFPWNTMIWIDTKDISDCAVAIFSESIEKHDRNVYEMDADNLSNEQRGAIFSKVLGRPIIYEQKSMEDFYKTCIGFGMSHSLAFNFVSYQMTEISMNTTPEIALLINRPLRTLEDWTKENANAFQ